MTDKATDTGNVWAIVLAGGDGRRVRDLSRDERDRRIPKQF